MINLSDKIGSFNDFSRGSLHATYGNMVARNRFIKRVFSILGLQLLVTIGFILLNMFNESFASFQDENTELYFLAMIISIVSLTVLGCMDKMSTKFPHNLILLSIFTLAESYMVSSLCSYYDADSVLNAALATLAVTLGLTLYAVKTKADFSDHYSRYSGFFWAFFFVVIFLVLANLFFIRCTGLALLISVAIAGVFCWYLMIDIQLIMGGRKKQFRTDQYIMGAVMLYTDIIQIFITLLQLLGQYGNRWRNQV